VVRQVTYDLERRAVSSARIEIEPEGFRELQLRDSQVVARGEKIRALVL
jgi:hypothetical protein